MRLWRRPVGLSLPSGPCADHLYAYHARPSAVHMAAHVSPSCRYATLFVRSLVLTQSTPAAYQTLSLGSLCGPPSRISVQIIVQFLTTCIYHEPGAAAVGLTCTPLPPFISACLSYPTHHRSPPHLIAWPHVEHSRAQGGVPLPAALCGRRRQQGRHKVRNQGGLRAVPSTWGIS